MCCTTKIRVKEKLVLSLSVTCYFGSYFDVFISFFGCCCLIIWSAAGAADAAAASKERRPNDSDDDSRIHTHFDCGHSSSVCRRTVAAVLHRVLAFFHFRFFLCLREQRFYYFGLLSPLLWPLFRVDSVHFFQCPVFADAADVHLCTHTHTTVCWSNFSLDEWKKKKNFFLQKSTVFVHWWCCCSCCCCCRRKSNSSSLWLPL